MKNPMNILVSFCVNSVAIDAKLIERFVIINVNKPPVSISARIL